MSSRDGRGGEAGRLIVRVARVPALLLVVLALTGCLGSGREAGAEAAEVAPTPACREACAVVIDTGAPWEPAVAVDPTDPLHVVASSQDQSPSSETGMVRSWGLSHVTFDGGLTWETVRLPGGLEGDPAHPLFRFGWMDDSAPAFLPDGTLLWSAIVIEPSRQLAPVHGVGASLVVLRSVDGGLTFDDVVVVADGEGWRGTGIGPLDLDAPGASHAFHDKQWFAIAPDGLALLVWDVVYRGHLRCPDPWVEVECTELVFSTSRDGGRTWTPPAVIADGGIYSGAFPLILEDGTWVVSYRDTTASEAVVAVSADAGASWSSTVVDLATKFPVLAKGPGPGGERVTMAYPRSADHHDSLQDVALRWSDDGGATWSAPLTLDVGEHEGRTNPAIASDGAGGVYVTYWHVLDEGAELRATHVRNGVASAPLVLGVTEGPTWETGDYMGLAALPDGGAYAVWNARHGKEMRVTSAWVE